MVKGLINHDDEDFSLNDMDAEGKTVFHICAEKGISTENEILIGINTFTKWKYFLPFFVGSVNIAKILRSHGANVSAVDEFGHTPLHRAAAYGNIHLVCLNLS